MRKHRCMTHQLVHNIRLGCVEGLCVVADVLRGVEDPEGESIEELTLRQETAHGLKSPASAIAQEVRDIVKLGNLSLTKVDFFLELSDGPIEFIASVLLVHIDEVFVAECPHVLLLLGVVETGNSFAHFVVHGHLSDLVSALDVLGVAEARVVSILDAVSLGKDSLADVVEVVNIDGEPGHRLRANLSNSLGEGIELRHRSLHIVVLEAAMEVDVKVDDALVVGGLGRARRDRSHVDVVLVQDGQGIVQNSGTVLEGEQNANAVLHLPELDSVVGVALSRQSVSELAHAHHAAEASLLGKEKAGARDLAPVLSGAEQFAEVWSEALHDEWFSD
mmetsp:Transcript_23381/g.29019  ORF Transcript_23381/g.29019 Transcript_23381/m.29019 type:complete len:333 (+) Transcript_23381:659-1657(+)